jgi:hypothetical protein
MLNKALVLENHRGVMEHKRSWCINISRVVASDPVLGHLQLDSCSALLSCSFSQDLVLMHKQSWCINISRAIASDPMLGHLQLDLCSALLNCSFSQDLSQLDKDSLPRSIK